MLLFSMLLFACRSDSTVDTEEKITETIVDNDNDGFLADEDCDDSNSLINPGAEELCDGADNNCDGEIDEGVLDPFYLDYDQDGFGDETAMVEACEQPEGYVGNGTDCDDSRDSIYPGAEEVCDAVDNDCNGEIDEELGMEFYTDADGDGFGDVDAIVVRCDIEMGLTWVGGDCDDSNAAVSPAAEEVCDEVDNDCNGEVDDGVLNLYYLDSDEDGFGDLNSPIEACSATAEMVEDHTDCDDTNNAISPTATEICDGSDNNCDGEIDEDTADGTQTWFADFDGDGFGDANSTTQSCDQPMGYTVDNTDCDDDNNTISPTGIEICDMLDNDCDGQTDESTPYGFNTFYLDSDGDGQGDPTQITEACFLPAGHVNNGGDCDDSDANSTVIAIDGDCDGSLTNQDCDDSDPNSTTLAQDGDCDGSLTADDCDDNDPNSTNVATDADCDGTLTAADCDDTNPISYTVAQDGDCDEIITADDCDDSDPNSTIVAEDTDCDGTLSAEDCNDNDPTSTILANDADCDGTQTAADCDDNDASSYTMAEDADCDQTPTAFDCNDNDPNSTTLIEDGDCDGALTADDCDDADAGSNTLAQDGDCDGILTAEDCDDANPVSTIVASDADCDGTLTAEDCNDNDANSTILSTDADCDGASTPNDCNDNDPNSTILATDADCDSVLTADDCNDYDPNSTVVATDADCDGAITANDCNDNDAASTTIANDADCDGTQTASDCNDNDPNSTTLATDADCDSILTADDCNDYNPNSTTVATDADCDGFITALDCDDNNPGSTTTSNDPDCDGYTSGVDCDNNNPNSTTIYNDADCDGIPTGNDCNDYDAGSTSISNDSDCDGVPNSSDAFPNDSSQWESWTLCGSLKHSNAQSGFTFLVETWGSSSPSLTAEGFFCGDIPMNQMRAEVHSSSNGGIIIDTGQINVGYNPFSYGITNETWSNGTGIIGLTLRSSWGIPYMQGTDCGGSNNSYSQGSSICITDGNNYQTVMGNLNSYVYGHYIWMCDLNHQCSGPVNHVVLIYARQQ